VIDVIFVTVVAGSFVAAVVNAAFAAGGALILLAVTTTVLPVQAVVPIHSFLLIGSTVSRFYYFREFIDWKIAGPFLVGSALGALVGSGLYVELPEVLLATAISILMLVSVWMPRLSWQPAIRHPWAIVGFLHTLFSTLFAFGAVLQSVILHTKLERREILGTMAGGLTGMGVFKIAGYAFYGFDYSPYVSLIAAAIVVSFIGTWVGKLLVDKIPEKQFRFGFRILITVIALRLLYSGLAEQLS
jgi:uncharacterized membrane protein YfcA